MKRENAMMPGYGAKPAPPTVQIDPKTLTDVACVQCGGKVFDKKVGIKELSALHPQNVTRQGAADGIRHLRLPQLRPGARSEMIQAGPTSNGGPVRRKARCPHGGWRVKPGGHGRFSVSFRRPAT